MTRDLPRGFLRAEAQWLEEPDEPREDTYDDYCEQQYEYWRDMDMTNRCRLGCPLEEK